MAGEFELSETYIIKKLDQRRAKVHKRLFLENLNTLCGFINTEALGISERVRGMRLCYFIEEARGLIRVSLETNRENK